MCVISYVCYLASRGRFRKLVRDVSGNSASVPASVGDDSKDQFRLRELVSIKNAPKAFKISLLKELGYDSDGEYVTKNGERFLDIYVGKPILLDRMVIFPGSIIILDDNAFSIGAYLSEHPQAL